MADRVIQSQGSVASIRKGEISRDLLNLLTAVGNELDVYFEVTSGGQKERSAFTKRGVDYTGSTRHDNGMAADTKAFTLNPDGSKHYLDFSDPDDLAVWERIVQLSVSGGATGIGAGTGYMGNKTVHIGYGSAGTWGDKGKSSFAPQWLKESYSLGKKTPPMNIPEVRAKLDTDAPVPATLTRGIDNARINFTANTANTPLPRPRPTFPTVDTKTLTDPRRLAEALGVLDNAVAMGITPRLTPEGTTRSGGVTVVDMEKGLGSLLNPKSVSPSTPNPVKPSVANQVKVPTGPTIDPIGKGATLADFQAFTEQVPDRFNTGQGVAGTVQMPADARPAMLPPKPVLTLQPKATTAQLAAPGAGLTAVQKAAIAGSGAPVPAIKPAGLGSTLAAPTSSSGAALVAPGAGLTAAQRNAMTSLAGTGMANVLPPTPAAMSPGLRTAALPKSNPITVSKPQATTSVAPAQSQFYQAGGYIYAANPAGGYTKIGKVPTAQHSATMAVATSQANASPANKSSASSSSVPNGYTDLGNGKMMSESGGIYYTRNL